MPPSKSTLFSLILPVFLAGLISRPPVFDEYALRLADQVQSANITAEKITEKIDLVVHSSGFKFFCVYAVVAVLMCLAVKLYKALTEPLAVYANETEIAYQVDGPADGKTAQEQVNDYKRVRQVGELPPVYPNGWMAILRSEEVKKEDHKFVHVAGRIPLLFYQFF